MKGLLAVVVDFAGAEPGSWELRLTAFDDTLCGKQGCAFDTRVEVGASATAQSVELRTAITVAADDDLHTGPRCAARKVPADSLRRPTTSGSLPARGSAGSRSAG